MARLPRLWRHLIFTDILAFQIQSPLQAQLALEVIESAVLGIDNSKFRVPPNLVPFGVSIQILERPRLSSSVRTGTCRSGQITVSLHDHRILPYHFVSMLMVSYVWHFSAFSGVRIVRDSVGIPVRINEFVSHAHRRKRFRLAGRVSKQIRPVLIEEQDYELAGVKIRSNWPVDVEG